MTCSLPSTLPTCRDFQREETLLNGNTVTIRAVRPDDRERIVTAFQNLERETIYSRFFGFKETLSEDELARIAAVDFVREVMLVVTIGEHDREVIIGTGSFDLVDSPDEAPVAEIAFLVEEDYQGHGIAGRLLVHLASIARDRGVTQFVAEALADNRSMLAVFARSGLPMSRRLDGGVVHVELALNASAESELA
jgi:RimJ/RimL family protein N-acetyltransferase